MLSYTIGRSSISVMIDDEFNSVDKSAANYEALKAELQKPEDERDITAIRNLISTKKMIEAFSYGKVTITEDEQVLYDGEPITNYLALRMIQIMEEGYDVTPFAKFMERVYANPQAYTRDELYEWLEAADLPIMADGRFVAFKKVLKNYKDCHSGMFDNSVGQTLVMDRKSCDPNRNNECSVGFHFCSAGYLCSFRGERVMVLAIDPADVTAIPRDYGRTKGRTCRYEVIGELDSQSEAYKDAWKRGVVEFDDDRELPDVKFESKPKAVKLKPVKLGKDRTKASMKSGGQAKDVGPGVNNPVKKTVGKKVTDAAKKVVGLVFKSKTLGDITEAQIRDAMQQSGGSVRGAAKALGMKNDSTLRGWLNRLPDVETTSHDQQSNPNAATKASNGDLIFKTSDGRTFSEQQVKSALLASKNNIRAAGRALGVGESTIRGWRSKGGF